MPMRHGVSNALLGFRALSLHLLALAGGIVPAWDPANGRFAR